jgi:hypothetical protein
MMQTATATMNRPVLKHVKQETMKIDTTFVDTMLKKYHFHDNGKDYKSQLAEARAEKFAEYL